MGLTTILAQSFNKEVTLRNIKSLRVSYKHNENRYILNVSGTHANQLEEHCINNSTEINSSVDRKIFLKTVLGNINNKCNENYKSQKIVIDYSSPNIAKPFHVGHLRSSIIGNFIANINKYFNQKVTKLNYLGDWGTQFGLLQYGLKAKNIDATNLHTNPIKTLFDAYVYANQLAKTDENVHHQARKYFSDIEQGKTSLENWKAIRKITVQELEKVYQRLGIQFDEYHWESDYNGREIKDIMEILESKGIIRNNSLGMKVANISNRDVTVIKSDNSTLYLSRDIAALLDRYMKFEFDKMLYVVDNSQTDHFSALFDVVKQVNSKCIEGCQHIKFGRIKGMSTRSGNVVFLNDILDEAKKKMHEKQSISKNTRSLAMNDATCDILGISAVVLNDLKQRRVKDYVFDWGRALQSEGDTGIKLQYLHCRLWSLEQNSGASLPDQCDPDYLPEEIVGDVVAELAKFEHILQRSCEEYEACILVNYLFRLARHVNRMFNELKIKNIDADLAAQRLLVFHSARVIVKTSLEILGVKPLNEM